MMIRKLDKSTMKRINRMVSICRALSECKFPKNKARKLITQTIRLRKYRETVVKAMHEYQKWVIEEKKKREKKSRKNRKTLKAKQQ